VYPLLNTSATTHPLLLHPTRTPTPSHYPLSHTTLFRSAANSPSHHPRRTSFPRHRTISIAILQPWQLWRFPFYHPEHLHPPVHRSEEHTSELQSRENLVCRLLLEKKKFKI